jgi:hypothetical protein
LGNGSLTLCFGKFWVSTNHNRETAWFQLTGERAVWTNYQVPHPCQSCECLENANRIAAKPCMCGDEGTHHFPYGCLGVLPCADVRPHGEYPPRSGRLPGPQAVGVPFGSMGQMPPRTIEHVPHQLPPTPEIMAQSCTIRRAVACYFLWDYICKNRPALLKPLKRLVKQYLPPSPIFLYKGEQRRYKKQRHEIFHAEKREKKRRLEKLHDKWLRYFPVQVMSQSQLRIPQTVYLPFLTFTVLRSWRKSSKIGTPPM